jgi:hypothetical protein
MGDRNLQKPVGAVREQQAVAILVDAFEKAGWRVRQSVQQSAFRPDLLVGRGKVSYAVEVKSAPEGRSDRLIPLWSQAYLQAIRAAGSVHPPLAVVAAPRIAPPVAEHVLRFAGEYAPDGAAGVIDFEGLRMFRGPHLEELGSAHVSPSYRFRSSPPSKPVDLFSDLNQWMLKVLLAPELPDALLSAPRGRYRNASQLARAANVSVMSAFRLVQSLQGEGYLHESAPYLRLVRREQLFRRWQEANARPVHEVPMRFVLRGDPRKELRRLLSSGRACLGLFAAAEVLHFGFVHGVPPHVYVQGLRPRNLAAWKSVAEAEPGEKPDLILREASAPQSVFRGQVRADSLPVSDILQVWLDVSSSASRGREQAELIRKRVLNGLMKESRARE